MSYTVLDADGEAIAGDEILDDRMRAVADEHRGSIVDDEGVAVYESGAGDG